MNNHTFSGHLGQDCRTGMAGDTPVVNFSVGMTVGYGQHKKTEWVECAYFGKAGQSVAPYLKKGQAVVVNGEASIKAATDKYPAKLACRVAGLTLMGKVEAREEAKPAEDIGEDVPF